VQGRGHLQILTSRLRADVAYLAQAASATREQRKEKERAGVGPILRREK